MVQARQILEECQAVLDGTVLVESWGETGLFYNPGRVLKRGVYVLTVKEKDGANDRASHLDREQVYRLNIGLPKEMFRELFGPLPPRPPAGGVVKMDVDFAALDLLLPHPVYAWMGWICVLAPSEETYERLKPMIWEAHRFAAEKFALRRRKER